MSVLDNRPGPARDIVALNAGAAIYVAGKATSMEQGVSLAIKAIESGAARRKLEQFAAFTQAAGKA
jgi:anthranilate phosphoribosyltransferase